MAHWNMSSKASLWRIVNSHKSWALFEFLSIIYENETMCVSLLIAETQISNLKERSGAVGSDVPTTAHEDHSCPRSSFWASAGKKKHMPGPYGVWSFQDNFHAILFWCDLTFLIAVIWCFSFPISISFGYSEQASREILPAQIWRGKPNYTR